MIDRRTLGIFVTTITRYQKILDFARPRDLAGK